MKRYITNHLFIKVFSIVVLTMFMWSCTDEFEDYNTNKSKLMEISVKELTGLFSKAQMGGSDWLTTDNYNRMSRTITNHLSGYMTILDITYEQNTLRLGYHNSCFKDMFVDAAPALQCIFDLTKDDADFQDEFAVALVWKVFLMQQATDLWGPIPYTDAGKGLEYTTYESQKDVYYLMFDDLKTATDIMNASVASDPAANAFGVGDMIYNGSVQQWIKFANSLRLRLAIRISNIDPTKARTEAEAAASGNTLETTADDAGLDVTAWSESGNGLSRVNDWYSTLMSSSIESYLRGYSDPRMEQFFDAVPDPTPQGDNPALYGNIGGYHGMANGYLNTSEYNDAYYYSRLSMTRWSPATRYTYPIAIMYAAETSFLKAEGAWRGWNMGGTAQQFYENGIKVSMEQWTEISADSIQRYIESENTPVAPDDYGYNHAAASDIPVKFSTNSEKQFEQIITQKWLSNFPISVEAFAEYRRTRLPKIYPKNASANPNIDLTKGQIITRLPFVEDEYKTQPEKIEEAIKLLGNGVPDLENIPLWWDVNPNGN